MSLFQPFRKIARLSRDMVITEKLDGTNASIYIGEDHNLDLEFKVGSRTRWITPDDDNYGFAKWAYAHRDELMTLGVGHHFGEWWGQGIQRRYDLEEKRFSLFNVHRWCLHGETPKEYPTADPRITKTQEVLPPCVGLVPVLYRGMFDTMTIENYSILLKVNGSVAAPGFKKPEGIVVFHEASGQLFKKTIEKDEVPKGMK